MNNTKAHQKLIDDILFKLGSNPKIRLWPRFVGFDIVKKIKYGIKGETDLQGIVAPFGRSLFIEVKTGGGVLSDEQEIFRAMVEKFGGIYVLARSVQDAVDGVAPFLE